MTVNESYARIKGRIWQALAQSDINTATIDKKTLEDLVSLCTEAALVELDATMTAEVKQQIPVAGSEKPLEADPNDGIEVLLWEGRPFLSLSLRYTITDERLQIKEGLVGKSNCDIELVRVQSMDYTQTLTERLLNIGDVVIRSHDPHNPLITLNNVSDPQKVHEILRRAVLKARDKYKLSYREEM